ncbi:hypothetical protein F5Y16DRAFT_402801 [Xylariaceae sp. FL0255]|nr:hypothetical protein F5Y16DRAFT_402801 [Xylariaceae sp. FL0255]
MADPAVLFSLRPLNQRAIDVVKDVDNRHFRRYNPFIEGVGVLEILRFRSKSRDINTLTTGYAPISIPTHIFIITFFFITAGSTLILVLYFNILVKGSNISKEQCSFEIDPSTSLVMFYDRPFSLFSQVFGMNATPFELERPRRKAVVTNEVNTIIGMGGVKHNLIKFELVWHDDNIPLIQDKVKSRGNFFIPENPQ